MVRSDFLNGCTSVSLYSRWSIRQHKKILFCTKKYCVKQKKYLKFLCEIKVAQQNYMSHKNISYGNEKNYVAPKRKLMLTKYV